MQGLGVISNASCGNGMGRVFCGSDALLNLGKKPKNASPKMAFPNRSLKILPSVAGPMCVRRHSCGRRRKNFCVRALSNSDEPSQPIAPLQLESPSGQLLSQLLKDNPYIIPAAAEEQLERLVADREAATQQMPNTTSGSDVALYRRIAELKAAERSKALEEITYALIVQKFVEAGVSMIPSISNPDPVTGKVDTWSKEENRLEKVHSPDALEMIRNHLNLVLGSRLVDSDAIAQISKMRVGQVYTASVMYGYFLRRVDQRFQLEKSMNVLPPGLNENSGTKQTNESSYSIAGDSEFRNPEAASVSSSSNDSMPSDVEFNSSVYGSLRMKPCKLRTYVMSFDQETLQRYATMRSKEGVSIIERHAEALFGKPEIQIMGGNVAAINDEMIRISFSGLTSLVMEAVTFGSFLWDVESFVDSKYPFLVNS
eukprot:TRINITY_DN9352_c0_g1_i1.p1 TRINITY_DN9352_c0_g1~~TRINITY_DN9352_c0_g1_i1.p1  ORF type:complete len:427 (-),score=59.04 TRINITY_DN9352_c0_g1_i1:518-1798(-)